MITCVVDDPIDARQVDAFERFAKASIRLVNAHGGQHHGYFLPAEGASDRALALFSLPPLAAYAFGDVIGVGLRAPPSSWRGTPRGGRTIA
jgi:hypothetical protein